MEVKDTSRLAMGWRIKGAAHGWRIKGAAKGWRIKGAPRDHRAVLQTSFGRAMKEAGVEISSMALNGPEI